MENFFTNIDLITYMCKFLNYEEQFQLTQVSSELENIITNYVWKTTFQEIQIAMNQTQFVVSDTTKPIEKLRFYEYYNIWHGEDFLLSSEKDPKKERRRHQKMYSNQLITEIDQGENSTQYVLPFSQTFPNLTELCCWNMKLENRDLQRVAENFLKLNTLILNNCFSPEDKPLEIGIDINIQTIKDIKNLNSLTINRWPYAYTYSCLNNVKNIINQLKLQQLTLNGFRIPYESKNNKIDLNLRNLKYYKELDMTQFILYKINFLPHFENLRNLTLRCDHDTYIYEDFFISLLKSCKYLTHLHLILCLTEHFKVLPTLHELILEDCEGLTYSNLKTILSGIHLKCFKSLSTTYTGNFEYFSISPSLQKLEIITKDTNFTKLLSFNEQNLINLKELLYYANGDEKLIFSNFGQNLNVLNINSDQFIAEDCLKLKYLHKLKINDGISISDFLLLLKHGHLHELSIKYVYYKINQHEAKALTTNLRYLRLECNRFGVIGNAEEDFLLNLLNLNKELSLAYERLMTTKSIVQISRNRNFPKRFKNINVGGISIECNSIRNECEETMILIKNIIQSFRKRHLNAYFIL
ncbi:uncharacterized protein LOC111676893 isoform X3 [Lucilia cuprina]|uniref:uncharacterized protein LOC111676893 isoform X3 n=1 Tax=Lucilia cuprina TaxID=7375 RepID=UPI001F06D1CC|nr:uncharacterized protein LOC111676893 isoform X3 [Lucilia cuprina]